MQAPCGRRTLPEFFFVMWLPKYEMRAGNVIRRMGVPLTLPCEIPPRFPAGLGAPARAPPRQPPRATAARRPRTGLHAPPAGLARRCCDGLAPRRRLRKSCGAPRLRDLLGACAVAGEEEKKKIVDVCSSKC